MSAFSEAQRLTAQLEQPVESDESSFSRGIRSGGLSGMGQLNTLAGGIADAFGAKDLAADRYAVSQNYEREAQAAAPRITNFRDVKGLRDAWDYGTGMLGQSIPVSAVALGGALASRALPGASTALRSGLGATATTLPFTTGEAVQRQQAADPNKPIDLGQAFRTGAVAAGTEAIVPTLVAGKIAGPALRGAERTGALSTVGRNLVTDIPMEAATEAAGTRVQQLGASAFAPERDTSGDIEELKQAAVGGAAGGAGFGAVGAVGDLTRSGVGAIMDSPGRAGQAAKGFGQRALDAGRDAAQAGQEAAQRVAGSPLVSDSLDGLSSASDAAMAKVKGLAGKAHDYFAGVAPDLTAAADAAATKLSGSVEDQVREAREVFNALREDGYEGLSEDLRTRINEAGAAIGKKANRAFLFTVAAARGAKRGWNSPEAMRARQDMGDAFSEAAEKVVGGAERAFNRASDSLTDFLNRDDTRAADVMEKMGDDVAVEPGEAPDTVEAKILQSDERLSGQASKFVESLLNRTDVDDATKERLKAAAGDLSDKANRAFVAAQRKAAWARDEGVRLIDRLYQRYVEGEGKGQSKKSLIGDEAPAMPPMSEGLRKVLRERVVPAIERNYPGLMNDPDRLARAGEVLRNVVDEARSGKQMNSEDMLYLNNLLGDALAPTLTDIYEAATAGSSDRDADERFFTALNEAEAAQRDHRSLEKLVAANLTPEMQDRVRTTDVREIVARLQRRLEGDPNATPAKAQFNRTRLEVEAEQLFGENAKAVLAAFAAKRPKDRLVAGINEEADNDGESDDGYDEFGNDALGERDTDNKYFGSGKESSRTGVRFMDSEKVAQALYPGTEPALTRRIKELQEQFPDREVKAITGKQYEEETGIEVDEKDRLRFAVVVRGVKDGDSLTESDLHKLKADARYPDSPTRIRVTEDRVIDGKKKAGLVLDAKKILKLGERRLKASASDGSDDFRVYRARAFAEGLASVSQFLDRNITVPPDTVIYRVNNRNVTYRAMQKHAVGVKTVFSGDGKGDRMDEIRTPEQIQREISRLELRLEELQAALAEDPDNMSSTDASNILGGIAETEIQLDDARANFERASTERGVEEYKGEEGIYDASEAPIQIAAEEGDIQRSVDASGMPFRHAGSKDAFRQRTDYDADGMPVKVRTSITENGLRVLNGRADTLMRSVANKTRELGKAIKELASMPLSNADMQKLYDSTARISDKLTGEKLRAAEQARRDAVAALWKKYKADPEIGVKEQAKKDAADEKRVAARKERRAEKRAGKKAESEVSAQVKKSRLIQRARSSDPELIKQINEHAEVKGLQRSVDALNDWLEDTSDLSDEEILNTARVIDAFNRRIEVLLRDPGAAYAATTKRYSLESRTGARVLLLVPSEETDLLGATMERIEQNKRYGFAAVEEIGNEGVAQILKAGLSGDSAAMARARVAAGTILNALQQLKAHHEQTEANKLLRGAFVRNRTNTLASLMTLVEKSTEDAFLRALAKGLRKTVGDVPVSSTALSDAEGVYNSIKHDIEISADTVVRGPLSTVMHEGAHAATVKAITRDKELMRAFYTLMEHAAERDPRLKTAYGTSNVMEFVAEGLSNPDVQQRLSKIPASSAVEKYLGKTLANAWESFVALVRTALNLDPSATSALTQFLDLSGRAMKATASDSNDMTVDEIVDSFTYNVASMDEVRKTVDRIVALEPSMREVMEKSFGDAIAVFGDDSEFLPHIVKATYDALEITLETASESDKEVILADKERLIANTSGYLSQLRMNMPSLVSNVVHEQLGREGIPAAHDSPHRFDGRFNWRENKTRGEGQMTYGAGTYLSTSDEAHRFYKDQFSAMTHFNSMGDMIELRDHLKGSLEAALAKKDPDKQAVAVLRMSLDNVNKRIAKADKSPRFKGDVSPTYHVTIDADPTEILDWNENVIHQDPFTQEVLRELVDEVAESSDQPASRVTGGDVYGWLSYKLGSDEAASDWLQARGIIGHTYTSNSGSRNYVIYDDNRINTNWVQFSKQNANHSTKMSPAMRREIRDYIAKTLGPRMKTEFGNMKYAGEFMGKHMSPEGTIRVSMYALDPLGAAYHEALHGFIHQLNVTNRSEVANELLKAAQSDVVQRQLRELLKAHPAAMKQLSDPEEAAAYMFQFYADGRLTLKERKVRGVIQAMVDFFRGVLGMWSAEQNAQRIMDYFHSGEYAQNMSDRSAVVEVLKGPKRNIVLQRTGEISSKLVELGGKIAAMGHTRLRDTRVPALIELADRVKKLGTAEGDDPGWITAQRLKRTELLNKFHSTIAGRSDAEVESILHALQMGDVKLGSTAEARIAAREIRKLLDEMFEYMTSAGVDLGNMGYKRDYFPRVWDVEAVRKNSAAFEKMLDKYVLAGTIKPQAKQAILNRILADRGDELTIEVDRPGMLSAKQRTLRFITLEDAEPFVKKNLFEIMDSYTAQAARRAEWARRFGDMNEEMNKLLATARKQGASDAEIETARDYMRGVNGTLGDSLDPTVRRLMGDMIVYQNIRLLPLAIFSSVVDPLGIIVRGGQVRDAWSAFKRGMREIPATFKKNPERDEAYAMAELMGTIENSALTNMLGQLYSQGMVGKTAQRINDAFFRYNLMEQFNLSMRVSATEAAVDFIARHATTPGKHSERWLRELGLDPATVPVLDGRLIYKKADLIAAGMPKDKAIEMENKVRAAVNQWVDGAILRPDAADRPIWFNDPRFALISHLKQFTYSFQQTILKRVIHEYEEGNYKPAMALASYVPIMIASDLVKGMLQGGGELPEWKRDWTAGDFVWSGVQRGGLLGVGQFAVDGPGNLMGPTIEQFGDVVDAVGGRRRAGSVVIDALPANSLYKHWDSSDSSPDLTRDR